jgi:hypothetical protein
MSHNSQFEERLGQLNRMILMSAKEFNEVCQKLLVAGAR